MTDCKGLYDCALGREILDGGVVRDTAHMQYESACEPVEPGEVSTPVLQLVCSTVSPILRCHTAIMDHKPRSLSTCLTHHKQFVPSCVGDLVIVFVSPSSVRRFGDSLCVCVLRISCRDLEAI